MRFEQPDWKVHTSQWKQKECDQFQKLCDWAWARHRHWNNQRKRQLGYTTQLEIWSDLIFPMILSMYEDAQGDNLYGVGLIDDDS